MGWVWKGECQAGVQERLPGPRSSQECSGQAKAKSDQGCSGQAKTKSDQGRSKTGLRNDVHHRKLSQAMQLCSDRHGCMESAAMQAQLATE